MNSTVDDRLKSVFEGFSEILLKIECFHSSCIDIDNSESFVYEIPMTVILSLFRSLTEWNMPISEEDNIGNLLSDIHKEFRQSGIKMNRKMKKIVFFGE